MRIETRVNGNVFASTRAGGVTEVHEAARGQMTLTSRTRGETRVEAA